MSLPRACRNSLLVVRTLSLCVAYVSLAISTAGIAKAVWLIIETVMERAGR